MARLDRRRAFRALADHQNLIDGADIGEPARQQACIVDQRVAENGERLRMAAGTHGDDRDIVLPGQNLLPIAAQIA